MTKHSAIEIQISARVAVPRNGREITEDIIRQAIHRRANTGKRIPGIDLKIIRWRHGAGKYKRGSEHDWSYFARFLQGASIIVYPIRQIRSR